ncbi:hypothetical protein RJ640_005426 [Escallonia rubra]|uniref:Uncharacterized protein n=1 Tax=Escallonia rubra TaxID=112253 RepID=A0AA88QE51_9ASTE|nr:hypothetical protein RJ640_005426 [Escallonia rubra]
MASLQQEHRGTGGSNSIVAVDVSPPSSTTDDQEDPNHQKPGWRNFLTYVGPGFLVSIAYIDPGNFLYPWYTQRATVETDFQAGANHGYDLLWIILIGSTFVLIIQSLAANLGVSTGKHLSELCRAEYPRYVKHCLWLLAEIAVIAADIPEGMNLYPFFFC